MGFNSGFKGLIGEILKLFNLEENFVLFEKSVKTKALLL